jgi:hypothetical protein
VRAESLQYRFVCAMQHNFPVGLANQDVFRRLGPFLDKTASTGSTSSISRSGDVATSKVLPSHRTLLLENQRNWLASRLTRLARRARQPGSRFHHAAIAEQPRFIRLNPSAETGINITTPRAQVQSSRRGATCGRKSGNGRMLPLGLSLFKSILGNR